MKPRSMPSNTDAEASILGGVLLRRSCLDLAPVAALEVEDFYDPKNQAVFMAMRNLEAQSKPIDPVTVDAELVRLGKSESVGGLAYLGQIALLCPSEANVEAYAQIVAGLAARRRVIIALADGLDTLYDPPAGEDLNGEAAKSYAVAKLESVSVAATSGVRPIGELVVGRMRQLMVLAEARERGGRPLTGIPTGVSELDRILGGYQVGIVTVLGARPGMGKSSTILATLDAATEAGYGAHGFLLEDSDESQADRAMSRESGVPGESIRRFELTRGQMSDLAAAVTRLRKRRQWHLEEEHPRDVHALVRAVRREKKRLDTKLVVVDYLQLIHGSASKKYTAAQRHLELDEVMTVLMQSAKRDGVAYVVASQLNRSLESRIDKRPTLADLRESGGIEEKAKCVVFLYRGAYYGPPVEGQDEIDGVLPDVDSGDWGKMISYIVAKNSNGQTGIVHGKWDGPTMRVS